MCRTKAAVVIVGCALIWAQTTVSMDHSLQAGDDVQINVRNNEYGTVQVRNVGLPSWDRGVPEHVNFQGYLTDDTGHAVNGSIEMAFTVWTDSLAGDDLWGDTVYVQVDSGLFYRVLNIPYSIFRTNEARWMELAVDGEILEPRTAITSSPWAYTATKADSSNWAYDSDKLDGYDGGISGANIYPRTDGSGQLNSSVIPAAPYADSAGGAARLGGRTPGHGSQQIPISDGNPCEDLNADKLDDYDGGTTGAYIYPRTDGSGQLSPSVVPAAPYTDSAGGAERVGGKTPGNSPNQIPISNGTLCENLNAHRINGLESGVFIKNGDPAGEDLSGTYPDPTVARIQGKPVSSEDPNAGEVLKWTGSEWNPQAVGGGVTQVWAGDGITCDPNPIIDVGTVSFNTTWGNTWGDNRYVNENQSNSISTDMIQNSAVTASKIALPQQNWHGSYSSNNILWSRNTNTGTTYPTIIGDSYGTIGVWGRHLGNYIVEGVRGEGPYRGVSGYANASSAGRSGGFFYCNGGGAGFVGAWFSGISYKITGDGSVSCIMPTRDGTKVLFAPEGPEPFFEDFGHGRLSSGHCRIELDPLFLDCIKTNADHPMMVFVQLNDDCNGVYVKTDITGFDVHELHDGKSNASFTYRVVANRKDTDYVRFPSGADIEESISESSMMNPQTGSR